MRDCSKVCKQFHINGERSIIYDQINYKYPNFHVLCKHDVFVFLMTMNEDYLLTLLGKLLHKAFNKRVLIYSQS